MERTLEGKVIAIIGASSGIGEGIARATDIYSPKGIVLAARRKEKLEELATKLNSDTLVVPTDVASSESIQNLVQQTLQKYGHLDILINSAGVIQKETPIENLEEELIDRIISTNLRQALLVGKYIAPHFKERGSGIYLLISSQAGKHAFANETAYNASKAGADHFIRSLHEEWKQYENIQAFALGPGFIDTGEARRQFPNVPEDVWKKSPKPIDFGKTVLEYALNPRQKVQEGGPVHHIETAKF